ncbi:FAST kinase domain-containing protein 4 [Cephus cinctus]|uniref:FAST kinase domain-containing protein 4 n=1 Tax=Cephus cinctus TaxID=211228 RepID=A0AAJ7BMS7_CEPCN|nr:FAST kinase domain-containing protein 4 [Cephus cinctus]
MSTNKLFKSLKNTDQVKDSQQNDTLIITSTTTVNELLKIANQRNITRENAFKIVSTLMEWSNHGKVQLSEFEMDKRFLNLCQLIGNVNKKHPAKNEARRQHSIDELATFFGLTEVNEATKKVSDISLPEMIKVMTALAQKKRRPIPLLRSLAYNISRVSSTLTIKQSADLLYSMAILSFPDEVLMQKISSGLLETVPRTDKSPVIGSILTSLGLLRYKDQPLLDTLSDWIDIHSEGMRPQDLCAFLLTLATVGYSPSNADTLFQKVTNSLKESDMPSSLDWLDVVWSLVVLNQATTEQVSSVLDKQFITKLSDASCLNVAKQLKLLNINAAAQFLLSNYKGFLLDENSEIFNVILEKSKERQEFTKAITDTLFSLLPSASFLNLNVNTGMGFTLDAEFFVDSKCNPVSIEKASVNHDANRIAVLPRYYHDFCRGRQDPLGIAFLYSKLLEAKGYKVLVVPFTEYNPKDKLVTRVKYLSKQIQSIAKNSSNINE